jgi:membrane protein YqaA with SNARE-associated domain
LRAIGKAIAKYSALLWAVLKPLGLWGILLIGVVDGSTIGLPIDVAVAGYVYADQSRFLLYVLMASLGEAIGSLFVYWVGYKGGEVLLRRRMAPEKLAKIERTFNQHEFWALMFPAMLPPPWPFKLFELSAAAFEMPLPKYVLAIFAGRFFRFLSVALLTLKFGPGFVQVTGKFFRHHFKWVLVAAGVALIVWLIIRWRKKQNGNTALATDSLTLN